MPQYHPLRLSKGGKYRGKKGLKVRWIDCLTNFTCMASVGSNRGRFPPGRGGGYRGEGGRGRGNYGGVRGYGRGDSNRNDFGHSNRNDFGHSGGGRGFQNRSSEGYQRSDQAGNTTGRVNRGVGPGIGSARTQRVSA